MESQSGQQLSKIEETPMKFDDFVSMVKDVRKMELIERRDKTVAPFRDKDSDGQPIAGLEKISHPVAKLGEIKHPEKLNKKFRNKYYGTKSESTKLVEGALDVPKDPADPITPATPAPVDTAPPAFTALPEPKQPAALIGPAQLAGELPAPMKHADAAPPAEPEEPKGTELTVEQRQKAEEIFELLIQNKELDLSKRENREQLHNTGIVKLCQQFLKNTDNLETFTMIAVDEHFTFELFADGGVTNRMIFSVDSKDIGDYYVSAQGEVHLSLRNSSGRSDSIRAWIDDENDPMPADLPLPARPADVTAASLGLPTGSVIPSGATTPPEAPVSVAERESGTEMDEFERQKTVRAAFMIHDSYQLNPITISEIVELAGVTEVFAIDKTGEPHVIVSSADGLWRSSIINPDYSYGYSQLPPEDKEGFFESLVSAYTISKRDPWAPDGDLTKTRQELVGKAAEISPEVQEIVSNAIDAAAKEGKEVLLIDSNLAKPSVGHVFGVSEHRGLADALANATITLDEVIQDTEIPGLRVVAVGNTSLKPERTQEIYDRAKAVSDVVFYTLPLKLEHEDQAIDQIDNVVADPDGIAVSTEPSGELLATEEEGDQPTDPAIPVFTEAARRKENRLSLENEKKAEEVIAIVEEFNNVDETAPDRAKNLRATGIFAKLDALLVALGRECDPMQRVKVGSDYEIKFNTGVNVNSAVFYKADQRVGHYSQNHITFRLWPANTSLLPVDSQPSELDDMAAGRDQSEMLAAKVESGFNSEQQRNAEEVFAVVREVNKIVDINLAEAQRIRETGIFQKLDDLLAALQPGHKTSDLVEITPTDSVRLAVSYTTDSSGAKSIDTSSIEFFEKNKLIGFYYKNHQTILLRPSDQSKGIINANPADDIVNTEPVAVTPAAEAMAAEISTPETVSPETREQLPSEVVIQIKEISDLLEVSKEVDQADNEQVATFKETGIMELVDKLAAAIQPLFSPNEQGTTDMTVNDKEKAVFSFTAGEKTIFRLFIDNSINGKEIYHIESDGNKYSLYYGPKSVFISRAPDRISPFADDSELDSMDAEEFLVPGFAGRHEARNYVQKPLGPDEDRTVQSGDTSFIPRIVEETAEIEPVIEEGGSDGSDSSRKARPWNKVFPGIGSPISQTAELADEEEIDDVEAPVRLPGSVPAELSVLPPAEAQGQGGLPSESPVTGLRDTVTSSTLGNDRVLTPPVFASAPALGDQFPSIDESKVEAPAVASGRTGWRRDGSQQTRNRLLPNQPPVARADILPLFRRQQRPVRRPPTHGSRRRKKSDKLVGLRELLRSHLRLGGIGYLFMIP